VELGVGSLAQRAPEVVDHFLIELTGESFGIDVEQWRA
jgi:hypothetical protein